MAAMLRPAPERSGICSPPPLAESARVTGPAPEDSRFLALAEDRLMGSILGLVDCRRPGHSILSGGSLSARRGAAPDLYPPRTIDPTNRGTYRAPGVRAVRVQQVLDRSRAKTARIGCAPGS